MKTVVLLLFAFLLLFGLSKGEETPTNEEVLKTSVVDESYVDYFFSLLTNASTSIDNFMRTRIRTKSIGSYISPQSNLFEITKETLDDTLFTLKDHCDSLDEFWACGIFEQPGLTIQCHYRHFGFNKGGKATIICNPYGCTFRPYAMMPFSHGYCQYV